MNLRTKLVLYLVAIHLPAAIFAALLFRDNPVAVLSGELALGLSLLIGSRFVRAVFEPFELVRSGNELIAEAEFTTRFRRLGHPEVDRLVDLYNDMLERLRAERLRAEEQQSLLHRIIELSPTGIIMLDFDGRIEQMNPSAARLLRGDRDSIGARLDELAAPIRDLAAVPSRESQILAVDGRQRLRVWRGEFYDRGFTRDFYLIEELTDALRASEKAAYEKVIRMLSHEINNSIAAVSSLLESMLHYADRMGDQKTEFARGIEIAANRLRSLDSFTRDFADVVRIPKPVPGSVDLMRLVEDVLTLHDAELEARRIRTASSAEGPTIVTADKNQLEQVVVNVVRNAIEAIGEEGLIEARVEGSGDAVTLRIGDTGPGLSVESLQQVFTPFYSSRRNGRGLGLTIVQEILSNHQADFALRNRPDNGAEFMMTLRQPG